MVIKKGVVITEVLFIELKPFNVLKCYSNMLAIFVVDEFLRSL